MKVVKNINNNVALCLDSVGKEVIVFGKGIGFKKPPYEIDIKDIDRTFYNFDIKYLDLIEQIDYKYMDIALEIKEYATKKKIVTGPNLIFSLADHISCAIERAEQKLFFGLPIVHSVSTSFEKEMDVGKYALKVIHNRLGIQLPKEEASYIALNIFNSETELNNQQQRESEEIDEITRIISDDMKIDINEDNVSYSRFISHMFYLLRKPHFDSESEYMELLWAIKKSKEKEYQCALKVKEYLDKKLETRLSEDETLFLTLHISRLCERNDIEYGSNINSINSD